MAQFYSNSVLQLGFSIEALLIHEIGIGHMGQIQAIFNQICLPGSFLNTFLKYFYLLKNPLWPLLRIGFPYPKAEKLMKRDSASNQKNS